MKPKLQLLLEEQGYTNIHAAEKCAGEICMIHNPTHHHMLDWPVDLRLDKGIAERTCPHGIGHPDPDSLAFASRNAPEDEKSYFGIHGCDGCCMKLRVIK